MSVFDPKSRYRDVRTVEVRDRRGRTVRALTVPPRPEQTEIGEHRIRVGQRLDHLANFYVRDPNGFWRIAEINGVMLPDALLEREAVKIPTVI